MSCAPPPGTAIPEEHSVVVGEDVRIFFIGLNVHTLAAHKGR